MYRCFTYIKPNVFKLSILPTDAVQKAFLPDHACVREQFHVDVRVSCAAFGRGGLRLGPREIFGRVSVCRILGKRFFFFSLQVSFVGFKSWVGLRNIY